MTSQYTSRRFCSSQEVHWIPHIAQSVQKCVSRNVGRVFVSHEFPTTLVSEKLTPHLAHNMIIPPWIRIKVSSISHGVLSIALRLTDSEFFPFEARGDIFLEHPVHTGVESEHNTCSGQRFCRCLTTSHSVGRGEGAAGWYVRGRGAALTLNPWRYGGTCSRIRQTPRCALYQLPSSFCPRSQHAGDVTHCALTCEVCCALNYYA